jgi:SAM-dependent methyltransferase
MPICPLCASAAPKNFVEQHGDYRLYDCPDCGLGFCDPFKNPGHEYYEKCQDMYSVSVEEYTDRTSFEYDEALKLLARELKPGARVFDAGCGAGGFLHRLRDAGFAASGLDFNTARVEGLRARGFDVYAGGLPDYARGAAPASYDAVTLFEVIEHVDVIGDWIEAAKSLLKPGGIFIVGTPNRDRTFDPFQGAGLEEIDYPPHHLTRWNVKALAGALSRRGLEVMECRPLGYPLLQLCLIMRYKIRFGMATRALKVEQVRYAPAGPSAPAGSGLVLFLVKVKEAAINAFTWAIYPFFRIAYAAFGWQGVILFAAARKKR